MAKTSTPRTPRPKPVKAEAPTVIATDQPGTIDYYVNDAYAEIPVGDDGGVMRAEAGDYVITAPDGGVTVMPPPVFAEAYPELVA